MFSKEKVESIEIEHLSWKEAEKAFQKYRIVLIALGARTKEHGPHLQLNNDYILAEYLKFQVMKRFPVLVFPTLQYGYYPAFLEYPGSVSLSQNTFRDHVIDICKSIAGYGIRKFYVLNTGISTLQPLEDAANELRKNWGFELRYLDLNIVDEKIPTGFLSQEGGTHADESETSMMLFIAPDKVKMSKAVKDYDPRLDRKGLTRNPKGNGIYSPTGIWGDPTLATVEKGKLIIDRILEIIVSELKLLSQLNINPK
ncbi:MAG: creatininase family protein [Candidatus Heimdallarchaeota archaeon]